MSSITDRRGLSASLRQLGMVRHCAVLIPPMLYVLLAWYFVEQFSFNWPHVDDFGSIDQYVDYSVLGRIGILDLLTSHDGAHPMGVQTVVTVFTYYLFGINVLALIYASFCLVLLSAIVLLAHTRESYSRGVLRLVGPVLLAAMFFHPVQTDHLTWAFEIGWFLIDFILVTNLVILERFRSRGFGPIYVLLLIATFCSAQAVVLWFCSAVHVLLLPGFKHRWLAVSVIALGLAIDVMAVSHITPQEEGVMRVGSLTSVTVYTLSIVGSFFSTRDAAALPALGAITLLIAAAAVLRAVLARKADTLDRLALLLVLSSLGYLAAFIKGRYQNGLPWALADFHAGPLLVPLLLGFVLFGTACWHAKSRPVLGRVAGTAVFTFLAASVCSSLPYMLEHGDDTLTKEAFAMHVTCNPGYSPDLVLEANLDKGWASLFERVRPYLAPLCTSQEPERARALEHLPPLFDRMISANPGSRDALNSLWEVYATHFDLQRAFPTNDIAQLLVFAHNNAETGSQYARDKLGVYSEYFKTLK